MNNPAPSEAMEDRIWMNGAIMPLGQARISPLDRGFLFGDGFFETVRAECGRPLFIAKHVRRLRSALSAFKIALDPMPDWRGVIEELLFINGLNDGTARVKIVVSRGIAEPLGLPSSQAPTVCILANRYYPPSEEEYERGWALHVFREGYSPPLARYKSLNYLYSLAARQTALDSGCREAVILDKDGRIAETSAGSLLRTDDKWWTPLSSTALPGITIRMVIAIMAAEGMNVEKRPAAPEELYSAQSVWVLNSLIGIMPVARIDGHPVPDPAPAKAEWTRELLLLRGLME